MEVMCFVSHAGGHKVYTVVSLFVNSGIFQVMLDYESAECALTYFHYSILTAKVCSFFLCVC